MSELPDPFFASPSAHVCCRCGTVIAEPEFEEGLAVRVLGRPICSDCVDSSPVQRSTRQGLPRRVYRLPHAQHPELRRFTFISSAHVAMHRRQLAMLGHFEAPDLPHDGSGMHKLVPLSGRSTTPLWIPIGVLILLLGLLIAWWWWQPLASSTPRSSSPAIHITPRAPTTAADPESEPEQLPARDPEPQRRRQHLLLQLRDIEQAVATERLTRAEQLLARLQVPGELVYQDLYQRAELLRSRLRALRSAPEPEPTPDPVPSPRLTPTSAPETVQPSDTVPELETVQPSDTVPEPAEPPEPSVGDDTGSSSPAGPPVVATEAEAAASEPVPADQAATTPRPRFWRGHELAHKLGHGVTLLAPSDPDTGVPAGLPWTWRGEAWDAADARAPVLMSGNDRSAQPSLRLPAPAG
ncbi:MAG: hypothetical protein ACOCXA_09500, partial [Planctomycetota bacterium]